MSSVLCINGPNLNRLGLREPDIYGSATLSQLEEKVAEWGRELGLDVAFLQANDERQIIDAIHGAEGLGGIVLNPGAFGHYSLAIRDAIASVSVPVVEVHISNVRRRDRWRRYTPISAVAVANIFGRGFEGYRAALCHLADLDAGSVEIVRYGPHPDQVIDVRPGPSTLGVIILHGGFWADDWGRDTTGRWAADLARRGIPSANVEFRRLHSGGGSVATIDDANRAVEKAAEALGTEKVTVVGHGTGAHLALHALARTSRRFTGVALVGGLFDLPAALEESLGQGMVADFDMEGRTSPLSLRLPACPVLVVHGEADETVPPEHSRSYLDFGRSAGAEIRLETIPEEDHFDALDPGSVTWQTVRDWLADQ